MAKGEGVGGQMWDEWDRLGAAGSRGLENADKRDAYGTSGLIPPEQLTLSSGASVCGICVPVPRSDFHPKEQFPGLLCLGSNEATGHRYFQTRECKSALIELAKSLSGLIGIVATLADSDSE